MKDSQVVDAFLDHLRKNGFPEAVLSNRPDEPNRNSCDIDAIAGQFAIEHTSIDSIPDQRRNDAWFVEVVGGFEQKYSDKLQYRLQVTFEYGSIKPGQDWNKIRSALDHWISVESPLLSDGRHMIEGVTDIPFPFHAIKRSDRRPRLVFYRGLPDDNTFVERLGRAVERKLQKLKLYSDEFCTILLLESSDIALMDEITVTDTLTMLYPDGLPDGLNQIWYADTSIQEYLEFQKLAG